MSFRGALLGSLLLVACDDDPSATVDDAGPFDARTPAVEFLDASEQLARGEDASTDAAQDARVPSAVDARVEDAHVEDAAVDAALDCSTSTLTYDNFGAQFLYLWCDFCHAKQVPTFNSLADIRLWAPAMSIAVRDTRSMPPGGNANYLRDPQREAFAQWLDCGAP